MAASWRDTLRPASFRGVAFEARSRKGKGGRRGADHEFPDRDEGYPEDTGRKMRRYSVDAFLLASRLGGNYLPTKNQLIEALEQKGPGEYIDAWGETWQVQVRDFEWEERMNEGGYVAFTITFVEYGNKALHSVKTDTAYAVRQASTDSKAAILEDFDSRFSARGNDDLLSRATTIAGQALGKIEDTLARSSTANRYNGGVSSLLGRVLGLRRSLWGGTGFSGFGSSIAELMSLALGLHDNGWPRYQAARGFLDYGQDFAPIAPTTTMRARAATNQAAMIDLVRGLAAVEAAQASADMPFTVYDDAVTVRDQVSTSLDERMMTAPDAVYQPLDTLRTVSVRDITTRGADLSRLSDVTNDADTPALVLAQRLYGNADRESDVLTRNPTIRHPGFIPGGLILKVPTDG